MLQTINDLHPWVQAMTDRALRATSTPQLKSILPPRPTTTIYATMLTYTIAPHHQCFNCGGYGHWRPDCPLPRRSAPDGPRHAASGRHHQPPAINRSALAAMITQHAAARTPATAAATPAERLAGLATVGMAIDVRTVLLKHYPQLTTLHPTSSHITLFKSFPNVLKHKLPRVVTNKITSAPKPPPPLPSKVA